jgi:TonB family protein
MSVIWAQREGAVVDGQFRLGAYIGGSGGSAVFRTLNGDHEAAIKLIPANADSAEQQLARWKLAVNLSHPHLIRLFRTGRCQVGGSPMLYAMMELADENLAEILPDRALATDEVRDMLEPVLDALTYLHRQGLAHGGLKPGNIMAAGDKLKLSSDALLPLGEVTHRREKPDAYDPPEMGARANAAAGDIWSLGVTLVETLTQRPPIRELKAEQDPTLPENLPAPFDGIARRCLRWNPESRCTISQIRALLHPSAAPEPARSVATAAAAAAAAAVAPAAPARAVAPVKAEWKRGLKQFASAAQNPAEQRRYIVSGIVAAVIIAGLLILPRWLSHRGADSQAPQTAATVPPSTSPAPRNASASAQPAASSATAQPDAPRFAPESAKVKAARNAPASPASPAPAAAKPSQPAKSTPSPSAAADAQVLNEVMPEVSQKARDTIQGKVRVGVRISVDASGAVTAASLESRGPSQYFADRALEAIRKWSFVPTAAGDWIVRFDFHRNDTKIFPSKVSQ